MGPLKVVVQTADWHLFVKDGKTSLVSASYLDTRLVCTPGMPVADMLAHFPPLALIIDHVCGNFDVSEDDDSDEGLLLALKQCDRTRRARLQIALPNLRKLIMAVNEEFPVLNHLVTVS
jgi:hypothetical protein